MSLFGFGDIKFNKDQRGAFGPLAALEGTEFKSNAFRYPIDVGAFDKGHYMVFYISERKNASAKSGPASDPVPSGALNMNPGSETYWNAIAGNEITSKISADASKIGSAIGGGINSVKSGISSGIGGLTGGLGSSIGGGLSGLGSSISNSLSGVKGKLNSLFGQTAVLNGNTQSTQKIVNQNIKTLITSSLREETIMTSDCIALYMPDTLMFNYSQSFSDINLSQDLAGKLSAGVASTYDAARAGDDTTASLQKAGFKLSDTALNALVKAATGVVATDPNAQAFALNKIAGVVENPLLELLYTSPNFRTFQFDFMFYPRSEQEALEVQKIIERFRYHQAPEFSGGADTASIYLIPPSEFDIKFYYGAGENPNIPKIQPKCVLETIDVNYAPNGWSAYEVPGENIATRGRTGMPTAIQLTLQFKETTYLTKRDFTKD